jgi:segregation and condensation protein B
MNIPTEQLTLTTSIEAILYLKGQPTSLIDIANYAQCSPDQAQEALIELMTEYGHRNSALEVVETPTGYSLQLRASYQGLLESLIPSELSTASLRTLAAIALKAPILQSDLINFRGSGAYQHVNELVELGFIRKLPQEEGRSYWLEVTDKFHKYFEINHLPL